MNPTERFRIVLLTMVGFLLSTFLSSQRDPLQEANKAYEAEQYQEALIYFNQIDRIEQSAPLLFKRGVCHYETNKLDRALADFSTAYEYGYTNELIDYYTGLVYHQRGDFVKAAVYYKLYLANLPEQSASRIRIRKLIRQCGQAINIAYQKPIAIVDNASKKINSVYDDFGAIYSPTQEGRIYFTSNRPNIGLKMAASDEDIYYIDYDGVQWGEVSRLPAAINRSKDEVVVGFTDRADGIYFYREEKIGGSIMLNSSNSNGSRSINLPLSLSNQNKQLFFWNDQVIFCSLKLDDGYGGYDLYAIINQNGSWSEPKNLGSSINSSDDELTPYLAADGQTLYFSSNRVNSLGGFDIYSSRFLYESDTWSTPINLGIPINSGGDETAFQISPDGLTAFFTSNRKMGIGGDDIYLARFKQKMAEQTFVSEDLGFLNYTVNEEAAEASVSDFEKSLQESVVTNITEQQGLSPISIDLPFLYYSEEIELFTKENREIVDQLLHILKVNPTLIAEIIGHSGKQAIAEYNIFSSIKLAERVQQYLVDRGIQPDRIRTKGLGFNYPIIKTEREGGDDKIAEKFNARIAIRLHGPRGQEVTVNQLYPDVQEQLFNAKASLYEALVYDELSYKIQLIMMNQMYRGKLLSFYNDATVERDPETGLYIYTIGLYDSFNKALQVSRDLERDGWTDVTVTPYINGLRMREEDFVYYVHDFPDLGNMMNYKK